VIGPALRWLVGPSRTLYIDHRRINMEVVRERRAEVDGDVAYRDRVKRRMLLGLTSAELAPLYQRAQPPTPACPPGVLVFPTRSANLK